MKISGNLCLPDNNSSPSCDGRSDRVQAVLKMTYFCEKGAVMAGRTVQAVLKMTYFCEKGASLARFAQKYAKRSVRTFHLDRYQ
jgi:hypothetical protein